MKNIGYQDPSSAIEFQSQLKETYISYVLLDCGCTKKSEVNHTW